MFEYEVIAKEKMRDFYRQAVLGHRADLAVSDQKIGRNEVGGILVGIARTLVAAYRLIARRSHPSTMHSSGIPAEVSNELPGR